MRITKNGIVMFLLIAVYAIYMLSFFVPYFKNIIDGELMYIISAVCILINVLYMRSVNIKSLLVIIPFLLFFGVSIVMSISGTGSYLNVVNFVLIILATKRIELSSKNYKILIYLSMMLLVVLWFKSISVWNNFMMNIDDDNPNTIAQCIVLVYGIVCSGFCKNISNRKSILFFCIISFVTMISILKCNCRTALIVYLILFASIFFGKFRNIIELHYRKILFLVIILGILFPFLYVNLYKNSVSIDLPFMSGKDTFTGRELIWNAAIDELSESGSDGLLFGLGSHHETRIGIISNFHNWYLGMIYYFGIPLSLCYFVYLVYELSRMNNLIMKISMLSVFIIGFSETSALWPKSQFIIFVLLLFNNYVMDNRNNAKNRIANEITNEEEKV